jgi:hypothetical protein
MRHVVSSVFIATVLAFGTAAQAQTPEGYPADYGKIVDAAKKEGKVVVYATTDAVAANPLIKDFESLYPGIKVEYSDLNSTELYNRFIAEVASGQGSADVMWSSAMDLQVKLVADGQARLRRVIEVATREARWGRKMPKGSGLGLAAHYSFVSYTAAVVEVAVNEKGEIEIPSVDVAFDCGPQVNPERVRSQLEGAVIMGLSLALTGEITFRRGRVQQDNFNSYRVMRMNEAPRDIRVHLLPTSDWSIPLGGVGEPGVPPIAPALCNAIFAASGKRIRQIPIKDQLRRI